MCTAVLGLPETGFTTLSQFCKLSKSGRATCDVEYKGLNAWIHLYATMTKRDKGEVAFSLGMHLYTPKGRAKAAASGKLGELLKELGQMRAETPVLINSSFNFPGDRFDSAVSFAGQPGFDVPLPVPVKVAGLRLAFETGPVRWVIIDVISPDMILVSPTLAITTRISERLPLEVLEKSVTVADKFVVERPVKEPTNG
jgi:hypothetical protein